MEQEKLYRISMAIFGLGFTIVGANGIISGTPSIGSQLMGTAGVVIVLTTLYEFLTGKDIELGELGALISIAASIVALIGALLFLL